jgi:putative transposase
VIPKLGISTQTFYRRKTQHGRKGIEEIRILNQLDEGNRKLKQLVADLSLEKLMVLAIGPTYAFLDSTAGVESGTSWLPERVFGVPKCT